MPPQLGTHLRLNLIVHVSRRVQAVEAFGHVERDQSS